MKSNYYKTIKNIKNLIADGKIKNEDELMNIPIDKLAGFNLCAKDLVCYFCYQNNNNKCIYNCD